jgi:hypothetical protein
MSPKFAEKLQQAGSNQKKLVSLMAEIDETKRSIKSALSQLSSEPDDLCVKGRARQTKIRRMKDKISFLVVEREIVRKKLGSIKTDTKGLNRVVSQVRPDFSQAFMVAAERILSEESFGEIETRAGEILQIE